MCVFDISDSKTMQPLAHCKRGVQSTARAYREKAQQSLSDDQVSQPLSGQNCERALVVGVGPNFGYDDACAALRHPFV